MPVEIERKFLVFGESWKQPDALLYCQGYLSRDKNSTVRVRVAGFKAYLTIKGVTVGACRSEFEYEIPLDEASSLLELCEKPYIQKLRHIVKIDGDVWEVDEFLGENAGLVVAEIELKSEDQVFTKPDWVGEEVTSDARYFNSNLVQHPFVSWSTLKPGSPGLGSFGK